MGFDATSFQMVKHMLDSMKRAKSKDLEYILGKMENDIKANGSKANKKAMVDMLTKKGR